MSDAATFIRRKGWDLQRFGLDPAGLRRRLVPGNAHRVLLITLPKSGTHLLERAVCLWPQYYRCIKPTIRKRNIPKYGRLEVLLPRLRGGQVLVAHVPYSEDVRIVCERQSIKVIFICRDLRDVLVSFAHHVVTLKSHALHDRFKEIESVQDRIRLALEGSEDSDFRSSADSFRNYAGWLDAGSLVVRFEDLVGARGGGSTRVQEQTLDRLWDFLDLPADRSRRQRVAQRVFSDASPTYRRGTKGGWQEVFDESLRALFEEKVGDLLGRYGYSWAE